MIEISLNESYNVVITNDRDGGQVIMNKYEWRDFLEGVHIGKYNFFVQ